MNTCGLRFELLRSSAPDLSVFLYFVQLCGCVLHKGVFEVGPGTYEQIATHKSVSTPDIVLICALQIAYFLRLCLSPRTTSRTISFSISNSFWYFNLIPFFEIGSVLAVLCWGMHSLLGPLPQWSQLSLFVALAAGFCVSLQAVMSNLSLSHQPPLKQRPRCAQRWEKAQDRLQFTIQRCPRISTYKFVAFPYRLPPILQTVRMIVNGDAQSWNGIERSFSRAVVPVSARLRYSALYHGSNSVVFVHRAGALVKEYPLSKRFSNLGQNCCHLNRKNTLIWSVLLAWRMPTKCHWVIHGRLTSERKASTSPSSFIYLSIPPLKREGPCLYMLHDSLNQSSTFRFLAQASALDRALEYRVTQSLSRQSGSECDAYTHGRGNY